MYTMRLTVSLRDRYVVVDASIYEALDSGQETELVEIPTAYVPRMPADSDDVGSLFECLAFWCGMQDSRNVGNADVFLY